VVQVATGGEDRQVPARGAVRRTELSGPATASKAANGARPGEDVAVTQGTDRGD
jgi:hypothetical protein